MHKLILFFLFILFISCKANKRLRLIDEENALSINCINEKYLFENSELNLEYSFDSIRSVKNYWKTVHHDQRISLRNSLYPYTSVILDTLSLFKKLKIGLLGSKDWRQDGRLKIFIENKTIDSIKIIKFFRTVSNKFDIKTQIEAQLLSNKANAEIDLYFENDSIQNISNSLKKIAQLYISFQKSNSEKLFHSQLSDLDSCSLDSLKRNVPLRIRLVALLNGH
jgi:hypothetical protein